MRWKQWPDLLPEELGEAVLEGDPAGGLGEGQGQVGELPASYGDHQHQHQHQHHQHQHQHQQVREPRAGPGREEGQFWLMRGKRAWQGSVGLLN